MNLRAPWILLTIAPVVFVFACHGSSADGPDAGSGGAGGSAAGAGGIASGGSAAGGATTGTGGVGGSAAGAGGIASGGSAAGAGGIASGGSAAGGSAVRSGGAGGAAAGGSTGGVGGGAAGAGGSSTGMGGAATVSYTTGFDLTELPISEGGKWTHLGLDWALIGTAGGNAYGTQTGTGGYNDSYAHLSGFPPNQSASGIIHKDAVIDGNCTHEVEILLHWSDAAHDAHGYECNLAFDGGYAQIVRWNGAFGSFTYLASGNVPGGVHDGDTLSASIVGKVIVLSVNGVEITRATDATFPTGNPGMGLWRGGPCGTRGDYGFTHYTATSLP